MKTVQTLPDIDGARHIVPDEASFDRAEEARFVASLIQGEADYRTGLGKSVDEVRAELRAKHGF